MTTTRRTEVLTVYGAGLVQGVALVTFPAANAVFTNTSDYGLSNSEYGGLFVPQALMAIAASLLGAVGRRRLGTKRIYLLGLAANLLAMTLLLGSRWVMKEHELAYGLLLAATACMGAGFGFTVPALNTFAAVFFPKKAGRALLVLNALLGAGTALAPVFVAVFVQLGFWWGLPLMVGGLLVALLLGSAGQRLPDGAKQTVAGKAKTGIPPRFWIFAGFALLYGVCETVNGNWAGPLLTGHFHANAAMASWALAIFWSLVTVGRILFAAVEKWWPEKIVGRVLPLVLVAAFLITAWVPSTEPRTGILTFALAGLGCSALLPLTLSFAQKELTTIAASAAGGLIAFYQVGYGVAAFGVGPLQTRAGLDLAVIFRGTALVALGLFALSFLLARKTGTSRKSEHSVATDAAH